MFEDISDRLGDVFQGLRGKGSLTEADVSAAMREVRVALLEADVSLPVVKSFIRTVSRKATGTAVMRSVSPGQMVIKFVHDEMVALLRGSEDTPDLMIENPPATLLMVGLQGSGKTTTTAKLAKILTLRKRKKVLMASLDTRRPAAMEQLAVLGTLAEVDTIEIIPDQNPVEITRRAKKAAAIGGYDILLLDTAGRLHIDNEMMDEVLDVRNVAKPRETLLVVDGLAGQDAVNAATEFNEKIGISGVILTRMEGDGRGGAALSMRAVTGKPIRFVGVGEKLDDIASFEPDRIAGRILGMGDIVSLVEKAAATLEAEVAERSMRRMKKGLFNMNDMRSQLEAMEKMGGMQSMMKALPGMGKMSAMAASSGMDSKFVTRQIALINSMTKKERANPKILQASRRRRIAEGAGMNVADLNKLLKVHRAMAEVSKNMALGKGRGGLGSLLGRFGAGLPGGLPEGLPKDMKIPPELQALLDKK